MDWHDSAKELCGHFTSRSTQETYTMDSRVTIKEKHLDSTKEAT